LGSSTDSAGSRPSVIVVTGPSGAGKGTLIGGLVARMPGLEVAVSATTRARREGERDGVEYHFLSEEEFSRRVDRGDFLEWVEYVSGHRYGTLRSEIGRIAAKGKVCVLELETEGALAVKETVLRAVTIFITAPLAELERRLRARATESAGEIGERLELARRQLEQQGLFDYVVENDDREAAAQRLEEIVHRELNSAATMAP
jgi:guanylate kinase